MVKCVRTAALLDLGFNIDISIKKTFEYYWKNSERFLLNYTPFLICNTEGNIAKTFKLLNNLYKKGYRIFIGFSKSSVLIQFIDWFNDHPDARGISLTSTAYALAIPKNVYRMTPPEFGLQREINQKVIDDPSINIYFMFQKDDFFSFDFLESFNAFKAAKQKLIICTFIDKITTTQLSAYLVNSKKSDYIVNGLINIDFLSVFNTPNYKVKPYIYDSIGTIRPNLNIIQQKNLENNYSFYTYRAVNCATIWRQGLIDLTEKFFSPQALDTLQVRCYLTKRINPNYLDGYSGIIEFNPAIKDRKYPSILKEDLVKDNIWLENQFLFDDPISGRISVFKIPDDLSGASSLNNSKIILNKTIKSNNIPLKTVALLETIKGDQSYSNQLDDKNIEMTFEYYWKNSKEFNLGFNKFPIEDTESSLDKTLELLNKYYEEGYRIFIGFNRSQILNEVLSWFDARKDVFGISINSTAHNLADKPKNKNIYRMIPIDNVIQEDLEAEIIKDPSIKIYLMYQENDYWSTNIREEYIKNTLINPNLKVCTFNKEITQEILDNYLVGSNEKDIIVNTLDNIDFFSVFNSPGYTVKPRIYDFVTASMPYLNNTQLDNIFKKYNFSSYRGINSSLIWRNAEKTLGINFSPNSLDTLTVNKALSLHQDPNLLPGSSGVLQFDENKVRMFFMDSEQNYIPVKPTDIKTSNVNYKIGKDRRIVLKDSNNNARLIGARLHG
jgi:hypothetical protein